ncbi:M1 family metallopeptidase [Amycolatopsis alba]|uniref:Aminopeptidase N n=1 Tax=Amycolatopsis alba DSM 44262 TaxID=1125972 RepID=A0A229S2L8_AMYAL|nr:M1 family metallopeptidase [Amycolatopsis alba]OXM53182.1 metallopeptidase [Amycolatopsis alba DSM 44262]
MRSKATTCAALAAALLLTGPPAVAAAGAPAPGAPGIGDPLWPTAGNGGYRVERQRLSFAFAPDLTSYTATSRLNLRATQSLSRFDLDLLGPQVRSVAVDGKPADWRTTPDGELVITPARPVRDGARFSVAVTVFNTAPDLLENPPQKPEDLVNGLWRAGDFVQLHTQPTGARRVLAVSDHPSAKTPTTIDVTTSGKATSVANGRLVATATVGDRTTRVFDEPRPIATELLQVGVGPITVTPRRGPDGVDLRYALPSDKSAEILPRLDETYRTALDFLGQRLGPFPGRIAGAYATPSGGATETQGLTWLNSDQLTPEKFDETGADSVIAHELAHEWFGNSVSLAKWGDLWLSEGHAVFYEWLWNEAKQRNTVDTAAQSAYRSHRSWIEENGPIAAPDPASFGPGDNRPFGSGAYQGGALTLYALRQQVGAETFQRIERAWVAENHDKVAGTGQFIATASRVASQDLGPFLRSWLYASGTLPPMPGHPDWQVDPAS